MINTDDLTELGKGLARSVKNALAPRDARLDALEKRVLELEQRPTLEYKGVWQQGEAYGAGSAVTHDGHLWIAREDTVAQPGTPDQASRAWTMAVRRGRDGRDAR